jgi:hypothetical protein
MPKIKTKVSSDGYGVGIINRQQKVRMDSHLTAAAMNRVNSINNKPVERLMSQHFGQTQSSENENFEFNESAGYKEEIETLREKI